MIQIELEMLGFSEMIDYLTNKGVDKSLIREIIKSCDNSRVLNPMRAIGNGEWYKLRGNIVDE